MIDLMQRGLIHDKNESETAQVAIWYTYSQSDIA